MHLIREELKLSMPFLAERTTGPVRQKLEHVHLS